MSTLAESDACPVGEFLRLEFFAGDLRLYPMFEGPARDLACSDGADPHTVVVAVARSDLPKGEFSLWVDKVDPEPQEVGQATTSLLES